MIDSNDFVDSAGLAKLLRVCTRTIRRWVTIGKIDKPVKLGKNQAFWPRAVAEKIVRDLQESHE